jgi:hypothetical protein
VTHRFNVGQNSVTHRYNVGQNVDLLHNVLRPAAPGPYEICRRVPASDHNPDEPRYRIKSIAEKHERLAPESELTLWQFGLISPIPVPTI